MNKGILVASMIAVLLVWGFLGVKEEVEVSPTPTPVSSTTPAPLPQTPTTLPFGETSLKIGETATFPGLSLTLRRMFDDSRCPTGVTCIWAGTVKAEIVVSSGLGISTSTIELGNSITTEAEEITLKAVSPHPKEGSPIDPKSYVATFSVVKRP
jgi:hypothetical protein